MPDSENVPEDLVYTAEHEWVLLDGDVATVGITAFAAQALGDVVYLQLPAVGDEVTAGSVIGEIESTKSVSEIFAPVSGEVTAVNDEAVNAPEVVNEEPYGAGWLIRIRVPEPGEIDLLDADAYEAIIGAAGA